MERKKCHSVWELSWDFNIIVLFHRGLKDMTGGLQYKVKEIFGHSFSKIQNYIVTASKSGEDSGIKSFLTCSAFRRMGMVMGSGLRWCQDRFGPASKRGATGVKQHVPRIRLAAGLSISTVGFTSSLCTRRRGWGHQAPPACPAPRPGAPRCFGLH